MTRQSIATMAAIAALLLLTSCTNFGYYMQCAGGHLEVMNRCRPIPEVLADPGTSPELKHKLETVLDIREFAVHELHLPDNASYRSYGDLGRPYVVWNVVAAGEFSLVPEQWCFPVAGCVAYRGYFSNEDAESFADGLRVKGFDVYVYGVEAYSTLNWFDDPVLNTFLDRSEPSLAGLIFHELSHQVVYVENDSRFNEAFATTVELEGVRRWLEKKGEEEKLDRLRSGMKRQQQFLDLLRRVRGRLQALYDGASASGSLRAAKRVELDNALEEYQALKKAWGGFDGFDSFFAGGLNNAKLVSVSTYQDLVPAFQGLLARLDNNLPDFYRAVDRIASLPPAERLAALNGNLQVAESKRPPSGARN